MSVKAVQEGCWAIMNAVMERKTRARGHGQPWGKMKLTRTPTAAYDVGEWMWGLERASIGEWGGHKDAVEHGHEWWSPCSQHVNGSRRRHKQQGASRFLGTPLEVHPHLEVIAQIREVGEVLNAQPWQELQGKVIGQCEQEEALGWRLTYPPLKTKKQKTLWPTTHGSGTWLFFTTSVWMTGICCPMSIDLNKDSKETWSEA